MEGTGEDDGGRANWSVCGGPQRGKQWLVEVVPLSHSMQIWKRRGSLRYIADSKKPNRNRTDTATATGRGQNPGFSGTVSPVFSRSLSRETAKLSSNPARNCGRALAGDLLRKPSSNVSLVRDLLWKPSSNLSLVRDRLLKQSRSP